MPNFNVSTEEEVEKFLASYTGKQQQKEEETETSKTFSIMDDDLGEFPDNVIVKKITRLFLNDSGEEIQAPDIQYLLRDFSPVDPGNPWPGSRTYGRMQNHM